MKKKSLKSILNEYGNWNVNNFQSLVGKHIVKIEESKTADEGFLITFDDGTILDIGWSSEEGSANIF